MTCRNVNSNLADLLFEPESVPAHVRAHVKECADCSRELAELQTTMNMLDTWTAPDPSPYFDTRMAAMLRAEKLAPPAGFFERLRTRLLFSSNMHLRPVAATALTVILAVGGAGYAGFLNLQTHPDTQASATIRDLQSLDKNDQVFQQLNSVDQDDDDANGAATN